MPSFDRFDICEAYYLYSMLYHRGWGSYQYEISKRLARCQFKARPSLTDRESLTENGQMIYDSLIERTVGT